MIEVRGVQKSFGSQEVLKDVNLEIQKGEAVVVIGRSGGGKSVLLKHLIGLFPPDKGQILVEGQDLACMDERALLEVRKRFGMLFQMAALFDSLNVFENVGFVLRRRGNHTEGEIQKLVAEALEMVELPGIESKKPSELSGGMRKRVGLARAIVYRPEIILYDEPTTGLDPVASDRIDKLIRRVWKNLNVTSIAVTHDMKSARTISNRCLMLHEGRIYATGPTEEMLSSKDPVIYNFVNGISLTQVDPH
ncbi:MAG TPA: ABC transporter ATP-binding protein [Candidatus Limnocylindria bacterium]|jgi:phospholipid/cholesterol/gamma-HCH transport system ATP-binding protein|nr:ABC transporter ATP-binding protein [Candidatus Limnocylindria bacterium]